MIPTNFWLVTTFFYKFGKNKMGWLLFLMHWHVWKMEYSKYCTLGCPSPHLYNLPPPPVTRGHNVPSILIL